MNIRVLAKDKLVIVLVLSTLVYLCYPSISFSQSIAILKLEKHPSAQQKENPEQQNGSNTQQDAQEFGVFERLRFYEGTSAYFDYFRGNDLDRHLDVQYSLKYLFTRPKELSLGESDYEVSFTFSGEFDFYALTRDSGPVIGRRYNPGFMYQRIYAKQRGLMSYSLGIEHESNGQSTNTFESLNSIARDFQLTYQDRYPSIPQTYYLEMATDSISRSTEAFVALGSTYRINPTDADWRSCEKKLRCVDIYFKFRESFLDVEDEVFWDPSMADASLLEHQGTQISIYSEFNNSHNFVSLTYRTGELFGGNPGKKNTFDVSFFYNMPIGKKFRLPVIASYHYGYLEELSRYSYQSSFFSLGLYFSI